MVVTLLANLPKSFVRVCARPLLDGQSRLSGELEGRDSFLTLLDGPTFLKICRADGAKSLGRVRGPVGTICPWCELPIVSWVFCLIGTSTVELGRGVHVGHYPCSYLNHVMRFGRRSGPYLGLSTGSDVSPR